MNGSSSNLWFEALLKVDKADVAVLQQFYFYRSAIIAENRDAFKKGKKYETAWSRDFVDRGSPPFIGKENCTGFALSAFNPTFFEKNPREEELEKLLPRAKALAREVKSDVQFTDPSKFLASIKRIASKYQVPLVPAPPGLMRVVNVHERGVGFLIHNFAKNEDFVRKNSMNFEAKYGVKSDLDRGFDVALRARTDIAESSLISAPRACAKAARRVVR